MANNTPQPQFHNDIEQSTARDHSIDTIAASNDVEEALPTTKSADIAPDGGYGVSCTGYSTHSYQTSSMCEKEMYHLLRKSWHNHILTFYLGSGFALPVSF